MKVRHASKAPTQTPAIARAGPEGTDDPAADGQAAGRRQHRLWRWLGGLAGLLALVWVLWGFDLEQLRTVVATADYRYLLPLPVLVALEQLIRAFKWRQFLIPLRPIGVWRLFGAIMVGYLSNYVAPVRVSPLVRAWLVARLQGLAMSTVLASIALDRLVDGFVFVIFTVVALAFVGFPDEEGVLRQGLLWGAGGGLAIFSAMVAGLIYLRHMALGGKILVTLQSWRFPGRFARLIDTYAALFAQGIVVPSEGWRRALIVAGSVAMKLMAPLYFVLAGLAFGVLLAPMEYLFIMVFLGFLVILAGLLRFVGSFTLGAVFVLGLFGIGVETAFAMAVIVQAASFLTLALTGAVALWVEGIGLAELRARGAGAATGSTAR